MILIIIDFNYNEIVILIMTFFDNGNLATVNNSIYVTTIS